MKNKFSKSWNSSVKPNKQRKFRFNAPLHIKSGFLNVHLSKELRQKYGIRSLRVRVGDRVKILRGQFKKQDAKVEEINIKNSSIYLSKVEHTKRDGTKARYPINPSNVMITELNTEDKKRFSKDSKEKKEVKGKREDNKQNIESVKTVPKSSKLKTSKPVSKNNKQDNNKRD
jgi:large subunit ribosomal protein L24